MNLGSRKGQRSQEIGGQAGAFRPRTGLRWLLLPLFLSLTVSLWAAETRPGPPSSRSEQSANRTQSHAQLPQPASLQAALDTALQRGQPLVVIVSLEGCAFCQIARQSYLLPLLQQGQPVVQINMRQATALFDATGRNTTHDQQVRDWGVTIAPTVLFLGASGKELAPRLVGAGVPDFYGSYLWDRVDQARAQIGQHHERSATAGKS